jgi:hypothetical protein
MSLLRRALADLTPPAPQVADGSLLEPPADETPTRRGLRPAPPDNRAYGTLTIDEGQQMIREAITTYLATDAPAHVLLIAAPAGLGKTTLAVETAERHAAGGGRVLYLGPRRDFYDDLAPLQQFPQWWYSWQPRTIGQGQGIGQTCRYAPQMASWLSRGYPAIHFCGNPRICGWPYIHQTCPWHAQARRSEPIIFGQYEHLTLGHPLLDQTSLLIGDELPLRAFLSRWHIPPAFLVPAEMLDSERRTLMQTLRRLCDTPAPDGAPWGGPALLAELGGAAHVASACADVPAAELEPPDLRHADAAEQAPYGHLFATLRLLRREAELAQQGRDYLHRIRVDRDGLTLLLRRTPRHMPMHSIWLDATASAPIYQQLLGRPVQVVQPDVRLRGRVYQVWASLNTKTDLERIDAAPKQHHIDKQVAAILARGYQRPAFATYKGQKLRYAKDADAVHFHGARGTNRLQGCDCLIVIGTPQPASDDLITSATMLYGDRDAPFQAVWSTRDRPYAGQPWAYPASGFWDDPDLQHLLEQHREAELIQTLHRARPLREPVDVWLLTNLPLPGVPVDLVSLHALFQAPDGVDPYRWPEVLHLAHERMQTIGWVTTQDFTLALNVSRDTARKWFEGLLTQGWVEIERKPSATRGKPVRACVKTFCEKK